MAVWKQNLIVLWLGLFLVNAGMTMIVPFLPLYLQDLGITDPAANTTWSGLIFAANFITSFFVQPIWGRLSDRYGHKVMILRSGIGMAIVMTMMGFATSPWQLLLLRLLNGTVAGFNPASLALMASIAPKHKMGTVMGLMQSGIIGGTILGPFLGGLAAGWVGFRPLFWMTGLMLCIATILAMMIVKEYFDREEARAQPSPSVFEGFRELRAIPQLPSLFAVTFLIQFSMLSLMPVLPLYIQQLHGPHMVEFYAGLVGVVTGISNFIFSPLLGRLADRVGGSERILYLSLVGAALVMIPQAWAPNVATLLFLRFLLGICMGGMTPAVNALIRRYTPDGMESRAYSFNTSYMALGSMIGPVLGGLLSAWMGLEAVFFLGGLMLAGNAWWVWRSLVRTGGERASTRS